MKACGLVLVVLLAPAALAAGDERTDLSGIWIGKGGGLVIHEQVEGSYLGHPTDMRGATGSTWHFHRLGKSTFRFWVLVSGGGAVDKIAESEITVEGETLVLPVANGRGDPGEMTFERTFVRIPSEVAGVTVTFRAPHKEDVNPDQYVERGLVDAFVGAVTAAKEICPDLRRILISATAGSKTYRGRHHRRDRRTGLAIGAVNGVSLPECARGFADAADRVGEPGLVVPEEHGYVLAAASLLACLSVREELDDLQAPDLLESSGKPFTRWFLENRWKRLPGPAPLEEWRERWEELEKSASGRRYRGRIVLVAKAPKRRLRLKKVFDEEFDRE